MTAPVPAADATAPAPSTATGPTTGSAAADELEAPTLEGTDPAGADDPALWYQDAVIYQLNVKAYFDSNGDGVGDFKGVAAKLDYVQELGVNTIWLMPFYPSPLRDDGYDISGYQDVHPQYGTLDDFRLMLDEAHKRGLKVITELVINHTSDQHPWFQAARRAPPGSPERDFYVWSDDDAKYAGTRIIFTDTETSNWTWDPVAKAYFWHRFFSHQPDLNFDNPKVLDAIFETMRFWLDMGVDGFRLDAIPYLVEREGTNNENLPETHAIIKKIRAAIDAEYANRFLLAEANQWPEDVREYFGDGDECQMAYHFPLMPRMYMSIAREDRFPLTEIMQQTPDIPANCQWAIFLRNHDELTLEMVTSKERDYMYATYAADPRARINVGIRRRLAPLMDNDTDRIKLMNSLLLSMRGSPIVYYGDEIGMGDNVYVGDRNGVRTPMQWNSDRNAGFSRADPQRLYLPPIMDAVYGYQALNVEAQQREPASLLNWMRRMLGVRRTTKAFGRGELRFLSPGNRKVLAYLRSYRDDVILCVANLAATAQPVELDLAEWRGRVPVELLGRTAFPPIGTLPYLLTIPAHGFFWLRLSIDAAPPDWHQEFGLAEGVPVIVLFDGWNSLFEERVAPRRAELARSTRRFFESQVLPKHLQAQRWFAGKGASLATTPIARHVVWREGDDDWLLLDVAAGEQRYFVPMALGWEDRDEARWMALATGAVAKVRQQAEVGVMADAFADEHFCRTMVRSIGAGRELPTDHGVIRFRPTAAFDEIVGSDADTLAVGRPQAVSSNTIVTFGSRLFLKGYRRIAEGLNPEVELGIFLTETVRFANIAPLAGVVESFDREGRSRTLCLLQAYAPNQGDGWSYVQSYLQRFLERRPVAAETSASAEALAPADEHAAHLAIVERLGLRTAELHGALATPCADPAFAAEPLGADDVTGWRDEVAAELQETLDRLAARSAAPDAADRHAAGSAPFDAATRADAEALVAAGDALRARIARLAGAPPSGQKTRIHGDYHLGQVLLARDDFVIVDFEGEPARSFEQRRAKQSPLRDVAGMLRSFDYARAVALRAAAKLPEDDARLAVPADAWEAAARDAFLRGYRSAGDAAGALLDGGLLPLFELQKALYELRYELDNRPDWVRIPLQGVLALAHDTGTSPDGV